MAPEQLVTTDQIAEFLKVTPSTIIRWRRNHIIPAIRVNSRTYRFETREVLLALRARAEIGYSAKKH